MNKKIFIGFITLLTIGAIGAINVKYNLQSTETAKVTNFTVENPEASAFDFGEWWDSLAHTCVEQKCKIIIGIPPLVIEKDGMYEACRSGSSVAHCWNGCNAYIMLISHF
jgi:hypothetical protein